MIYNYPYFGLPNYNKYINSTKNINMDNKINLYNRNNIETADVLFNEPSVSNNLPHYDRYFNPYVLPINPYINYQKVNNKNNNKKHCNNDKYNNENIIEVFGLKLRFDDVLIICILLFLFNENVSDNYLILSLIMLLLS